MAEGSYIDLLKRNNPGIYIDEKDYSVRNITRFYNRFTLVVGCSKSNAAINLPILINSPEQLEDIYGKIDYNLEKKESYFHRTIQNILPESPVIALNLRLWDKNKDFYNWQTLSTSSNNTNSNTRTNKITDFYDLQDGFWKRSPSELEDLAINLADGNTLPLSFVNMRETPVSILIYKSKIKGFDIPVEEWYSNKYPDYLHPKDLVSDYIVEILLVEGTWDDYKMLSVDPLYSKYFDQDGIKKDKTQDFINLPNIKLLGQYQASLIPYFVDKNKNDMYIQNVINNDINTTGIMCSFNENIIETEFRNGLIDLLGNNLTSQKSPSFDFLSYKRYITDFLVIDESSLDILGNSFGNPPFNSFGRTMTYSEGYVHNVSMKPIIISTTSTIDIKPFNIGSDSYGVINGKRVIIDSNTKDSLALQDFIVNGYHFAYVVVLSGNGIEFRKGDMVTIENDLYLPIIDAQNEIVLAYYDISKDLLGNYTSELYPVTLNTTGFIDIIGTDIEVSNNTFIQTLKFKDIIERTYNDYNKERIYHLWYWLSKNLKENISLSIDSTGLKQTIEWIEQYTEADDKYIRFAINKNSIYGTSGVALYMKDTEFLTQSNNWETQKPPLINTTSGIIGNNSIIVDSYNNGDINSGDPFFNGISTEYDVEFFYDSTTNQNLIIIPQISDINLYYQRKIIVEGSINNNGIFNILNVINYNSYYAIIVQENVIDEHVETIKTFDGENALIINIYIVDNYTYALIETWDGVVEELYLRLQKTNTDSQWKKTLEVKRINNINSIVVDYKYAEYLELGYYLLAKVKTEFENEMPRNWTRIIKLQRLNDTELLIETDTQIELRKFGSSYQTDILRPITDWVSTLDFKVLKPFKVRDVFPNGTDQRLQEILDLIHPNSKMSKSLSTDRFEWRYLVDSFGGGLYENSKYQLAALAGNKKFAHSFINVPSIKTFRKDGTKYTTKNSFDTGKLLSGGDRKNNIGSSFTLSDIHPSHATYLCPYITVNERGRFFNIPPSSFITAKYLRKFNDNNKKPWDIVAGFNMGEIRNISGLEERFTDDELRDMNQFGITVITTRKNIQFYLYNERTAASDTLLSYIHNRETLIELELSMYKELGLKQWKENDEDTRLEILDIANKICEFYKNSKAINNFYNELVVSNELIDSQIGVINTYIETQAGMQTILSSVNIYKTGTL